MQKTVKTGLAALAALVVMAGNALAVGGGSVNPTSGWFPAGTNLTVTAIPSAGDRLSGWSGNTNNATLGTDTITFLVDASKSITATFADIMHTITVTAGSGGSVTPGTTDVAEGENQGFTITPDTNYHIDDVLVDGGSVGAVGSYTFSNVTAAHTLEAQFALDTYQVIFDLGAHGTLTSGSLTQQVAHGSSATAPTFDVETGYAFDSWDNAFNNITAPLTVTALYTTNEYTLIYIAGANGSISGATEQTVAHGSSGTQVTAVASNGYHFVKWDDDVMTASRTDANVTGDLTVTASFAQNQYSFVVYSEYGTSSPLAGTTNWYAHGAPVDFVMTDSPVELIPSNTQVVVTGWTGAGSAPATGSETNGTFQIFEDSSITWQWGTNYWIELETASE